MRFNQSLEKKFKLQGQAQSEYKKPAVACSLHSFLKQQSMRIEYLLQKKRDHENKLERISTQNLNKRDQLREKIKQQQEKHEKNRKQFLTKRSKHEKFRIEEVERKRGELEEKRRAARRGNEETFKKNKEETIQYWNSKQLLRRKSFENQVSVEPLHEESVYRKKVIEARNEQFGLATKEKLLTRHNSVQERMAKKIQNQLAPLIEHDYQIEEDLKKHEQIVSKRKQKFVNDICFHQDLSKKVIKKKDEDWKKKLKGKLIDDHEKFAKTMENFTENYRNRAKSMKDCRCHSKGRKINPEAGMTQSINFQEDQNNNIKINQTSTNWFTIQNRKKDFMTMSQTNLSSVQNNKGMLREKQDLKDEKKLMKEKEIADAVRTRQQIKNDSNCFVRQARVIG